MKAQTRITLLDEDGQKFFGEGPERLLCAIEKTGSLRAAAQDMGMAYTKALRILRNAEQSLGFALTHRSTGGKDGGGSILTDEGRAWVKRYQTYRDACAQSNARLFSALFPQEEQPVTPPVLGCVLMASGMGVRFGGNKLLASFRSKPLIQWALDATQGIFVHRVVVTRHQAVAELCQGQDIPVVMHDQPLRSDVVRLGLEALPPVDGCLFCPCDQPFLRRETVAAIAACANACPDLIWRAAWQGEPGSPVLFPAWTFPELRTLPEGNGGSVVAKAHADMVRTVPARAACELMDVDTPEDLQALLHV